MPTTRSPAPTRWRACLALAASLAAAPGAIAQQAPASQADPARDARALFERGLAMADAERWGEAVLFFQQSLALVPRPSTRINLGNALVRSGRVVEAEALLQEFLASADAGRDPQRAAQATAMLAEARSAVVTLTIRTEGSATPVPALVVDGRTRSERPDARGVWSVRVDPGTHSVQLRRASDGAEGERSVTALPGATAGVVIALRAPERTGPAIVVFAGAPPGARVWIDGSARGGASERYELAPGDHTVEVRAAGFAPTRQSVRARPGEELRLLVTLTPAAEPEPRRRSVLASPVFWAVTCGVLVAAGAGVGIYFGTRTQPAAAEPPSGNTGTTIDGLTLRP